MLERMLGVDREGGPPGWTLLLLSEAAFVAFYFLVVERRTVRPMALASSTVIWWTGEERCEYPSCNAMAPTVWPGI